MTSIRATSIQEIRAKARQLLIEVLGPVDYIRYLQDIYPRTGDYTKERQAWAESVSLDEFDRMLDEHRNQK